MAEHQSLNTQVGFLIAHLAGVSPKTDQKRFASLKNTALQRLRSHRGTSINQFEVDRRLDGLQEKFSILDRDDLADALGHRTDALSKRSNRYVPEYLTLVCDLSGRPISRWAVKDLEKPQEDEPVSGPSWEEIIADEPLDETGVWDDVDFEASSDDDSLAEHGIQTLRPFSDSDKVSEEIPLEKAHFEFLKGSLEGLKTFQQQQFWDHENTPLEGDSRARSVESPSRQTLSAISELQAVRECILMLQGHPTSLFQRLPIQGGVVGSERYIIFHIAIDRFRGMLKAFASIGNDVCTIRQLAARPQFEPFLQAFWNGVNLRLRDFDQFLVDQERLILQKNVDVVSMMILHQAVDFKSQNLRDLLSKLRKVSLDIVEGGSSYRFLDVLHDAACTSQFISDSESYEFYSRFFFECLKFYLAPIRRWMECGELSRIDAMTFISNKSDRRRTNVQNPSEQGEYKLKALENQELLWPAFFTKFIEPIFAIGKSARLLGRLGIAPREEFAWLGDEKQLAGILHGGLKGNLAPFSESLEIALDDWIYAQYQITSSALREGLSAHCDIETQLDALAQIYLFKDGYASKQFTNKLFDQMDRVKARWNDPYLLTEWARTTIGVASSVDADNVVTRFISGRYEDIQTARRTVKSLEGLQMNYTLPWPMSHIVGSESIASLQRVFVFLLQISRSKYVLEQMKLLTEQESLAEDSEEQSLFLRIRHRLLWVANVLFSHLTETVIEVACQKLKSEYQNALDLDKMASSQEMFTRRLETQCMLIKPYTPIRQAIISLLDLAILLFDLHNSHREEQALDSMNRSFSFLKPNQTSDPYKRRKRHKDDDSSSKEETDSDEEGLDRSHIDFFESSYLSHLRNIDGRTGQLISFIASGLYGFRTTSETTSEILVQRLDWERSRTAR